MLLAAVLARCQQRLRRAIRVVKRGLGAVGLVPHPVKTWVGRAEQSLDFLGYQITRTGLTVATVTIARGVTRLHRLQEQQGRDPQGTAALGVYRSRWWRWAAGGLPDLQPSLLFSILTRREQISDHASSSWMVST